MQKTSLCLECQQKVSEQVALLGLKTFITPDADKLYYNPTNVAINMVIARCMEGIGIAMMFSEFGSDLPDPHKGCPIHFLESQVNEDRSCPCDDPDCESREPGSIASFFGWLIGPDSSPHAVKAYLADQGWL